MTGSKTAMVGANPNANVGAPATEANRKGADVNANALELEPNNIQPELADAGMERSGTIVPVPVTLKYSDTKVIEISDLNYLTYCWPETDDEEDGEEDDDEEADSGNEGDEDVEEIDDDDVGSGGAEGSEAEWVTEDEDNEEPPGIFANKSSKKKKKSKAKKRSSTAVDVRDAKCGTKTCKCNKPLEKNPGWPIFLTKEGGKNMFQLIDDNEKRNQANFDIHIYNDWSGWGTAEVLTNALVKFNKIIFDKNRSPAAKWALVEGLAMFLSSDEQLYHFMMNEDGPGNSEIVEMLGTMLLTCLEMLEEANLLSKNSPIKNIGFVSMLYINFAIDSWLDVSGDMHGETRWIVPVVRYLDRYGIDIPCLNVMEAVNKEKLEELRSEIKELEESKAYEEAAEIKTWTPKQDFDKVMETRSWHRWDWSKEWRIFQKNHKGGRHYDLSTMSAAEKRRYRIG